MVAMIKALFAAALLFAPALASAQLAECSGLGGDSVSYKVVMDDLSLPADAGAAIRLGQLKEKLKFTLTLQVQEFQSDVASKQIRPALGLGLVTCDNRKPSPGGLEFDAPRVKALNERRVVVEFWGNLLLPAEGTPGVPHALIGYVIPPVLDYLPDRHVLGRFTVQYPKDGGDPSADLRLPEASAFAMVGLGLKAFKAKKYDLATWAFGRSEASIRQAQDFGGKAELGELLKYVKHAACEVREKARADATYTGPLSLTPAEQCGAST